MSVHVVDSFPYPLYKGFDEVQYANLFIERGSFIMRSLSFFRQIEDSQRCDRDEGEGRVETVKDRPVVYLDSKSGNVLSSTIERGPVFFGTTSINPRYVFCLHGPQVDLKYIHCRYQHVVRIRQPDTLVRDIASYLEQRRNMRDDIWLECVQVRYDKDQLVGKLPEAASEERLRMSYGQKAPGFCRDCEYRIVLTLPVTTPRPPTEIKVELEKKLEYTEFL